METLIVLVIAVIFIAIYRREIASLFKLSLTKVKVEKSKLPEFKIAFIFKKEIVDVTRHCSGSYYRCYFSDGGYRKTDSYSSKWYGIHVGDKVIKTTYLSLFNSYQPLVS